MRSKHASISVSTKIVGIGFGKTGTSTLAACLRHFGYSHKTWDKALYDAYARGDQQPVMLALGTHQSFDDWPWPSLYREIDRHFPGSKFILTLRSDPDTWLRSLRTHAIRRADRTRVWEIYGMEHGKFDAELAGSRYMQHLDEVRRYFAGRPDDLLEVCWETGDGWEKLATFLGHETPQVPLPHAYATGSDSEYADHELRRKLLPRIIRQWMRMP